MSFTVIRCDYGFAFPAKLLECSVFVWPGQSTVYQPMEETRGLGSYNRDDVIPFSTLSQTKCSQTKKNAPPFRPHSPQSFGNVDPTKMPGNSDSIIISRGDGLNWHRGSLVQGQVQSVVHG